jgi:hypothetical protein
MTAYHQFVRLLYEARFASEAVDHYTLVESEDSAHPTAWHWLLNEQYTSALTLIEYVRAQADTIIATMGDQPANVPDYPAKAAAIRRSDRSTLCLPHPLCTGG